MIFHSSANYLVRAMTNGLVAGAESPRSAPRLLADMQDCGWYVTQTTQGVTADDLDRLRTTMVMSEKIDLHPIDVAVADAAVSIPRGALGDPWDRFILATARALDLPLVTRDSKIHQTRLAATIW